jgi:hypothetical protein
VYTQVLPPQRHAERMCKPRGNVGFAVHFDFNLLAVSGDYGNLAVPAAKHAPVVDVGRPDNCNAIVHCNSGKDGVITNGSAAAYRSCICSVHIFDCKRGQHPAVPSFVTLNCCKFNHQGPTWADSPWKERYSDGVIPALSSCRKMQFSPRETVSYHLIKQEYYMFTTIGPNVGCAHHFITNLTSASVNTE